MEKFCTFLSVGGYHSNNNARKLILTQKERILHLQYNLSIIVMQLSERPIKSLKNIEGIQIHLKYENRRFRLLMPIELFRIDLKIQLSELPSRDCDVFQFQKYSRV